MRPGVIGGHRARGRALLVGLSLPAVRALPRSGIAGSAIVVIRAVVSASASTWAGCEVEVPAERSAVGCVTLVPLLHGALDRVTAWWRSVSDRACVVRRTLVVEALEVAGVRVLVALAVVFEVVLLGFSTFVGLALALVGLALAFVLGSFW